MFAPDRIWFRPMPHFKHRRADCSVCVDSASEIDFLRAMLGRLRSMRETDVLPSSYEHVIFRVECEINRLLSW